MAFVERRIKLMSDAVLDPNQTIIVPGQSNELDIITDEIYYFVLDAKNYQDFTRQPWYVKLIKSEFYKDISAQNAKKKIKQVLKEL